MFKTGLQIAGIVAGVIVSTLLGVALANFFSDMAAVAHNGVNPVTAGNYTFYLGLVKASPLLIISLPIIVGGLVIFIILRNKSKNRGN